MKTMFTFLFLAVSILSFSQISFIDMGEIFPGTDENSLAWGDYDNDGDLDFLLTGNDATYYSLTKLYNNTGSAIFFEAAGTGLVDVHRGAVAWGDYDNDGDADILLTGLYDYQSITKIYRNNGDGTFTDNVPGLTGVQYSTADWGDYDNDGDLDFIITGLTGTQLIPSNYRSIIYRNDGNNIFTDISAGLTPNRSGAVAWGDYDNDCDLDLLIIGYDGAATFSKVYRNDGNDTFTDIAAGLQPVTFGSVAWGDYDNDGDLDILLTGSEGVYTYGKVYRNMGSDTFTEIAAGINGVKSGSASWCDYDLDGDLDILLSGDDSYARTTKVYSNNGNHTFTEMAYGLMGVAKCSAAWGDYNYDNKPDILLSGYTGSEKITKVYYNSSTVTNSPPNPPSNLYTVINGDFLEFHWSAGSDSQTPVLGLSYNLRVGSTSGGNEIFSSNARADGFRLFPEQGYAHSNCSWKILLSALPNHLYWSVQTIDGAFIGSAFADEQEVFAPPLLPQNVQFDLIDDSAEISWDPVTASVFGAPLTPDGYVIFYSEVPVDPVNYFYLWETPDSTFTHYHVALYADEMFYYVVAFKLYTREQQQRYYDILSDKKDLTWGKIREVLYK